MPRHDAHYELTDAGKRDLIRLIEQGKPLPEKYRFLLFEDKREVELVWNGKTREVCTAILAPLTSGALRRQIEDAGGLKLTYIDPPFDVVADFRMDIEIAGETFHKWQSFRTQRDRNLDLASAVHTSPAPSRYPVAVKAIDILGNDTMTLVKITAG